MHKNSPPVRIWESANPLKGVDVSWDVTAGAVWKTFIRRHSVRKKISQASSFGPRSETWCRIFLFLSLSFSSHFVRFFSIDSFRPSNNQVQAHFHFRTPINLLTWLGYREPLPSLCSLPSFCNRRLLVGFILIEPEIYGANSVWIFKAPIHPLIETRTLETRSLADILQNIECSASANAVVSGLGSALGILNKINTTDTTLTKDLASVKDFLNKANTVGKAIVGACNKAQTSAAASAQQSTAAAAQKAASGGSSACELLFDFWLFLCLDRK
ncbi:hypothetical protein CPB84DRAFT_844748 [Gymnopilus junonius]|uniref:Uncharacterized protein n=1 Tax=Gymnopilus junonius TaxID=109634 RepID=A0A9P5TPW5_GYMJU|nr:hypothetical protein CPB84DRAFT_844748 [Gymnopilus junonius]